MHGKTLLGLVTVIALSLVLSLSLAGCAKKKPAESKATQTPQLSKETTDTSDVFKEFYAEDSAAKKKAAAASKKGAKQETFSTASSPVSAADFSENGRYTVQVSCVRSQSFANSMVSKLKDKGYPAYVAEVQNPTPSLSGTFYRVRIGGFNAVSGAKSFGENTLIAGGYEYWVDKKSNDNVGMEGYGLGSGSAGSSAAGSYNMGGSTPSSQSQPSSGFGSSSSTESSFSTTPSSGSSSFGSSSSSGTTGSSSFESSTPSTTPASGSTGSSSTSSDFGSSSSSTSSPSSSSSSTSSSGSSFGSTPSSTGSSTGTSGTGSTGGAKDTSGGW